MEQPILILQTTPAQNPLITFAPILIVGVIFYLLIFMPMRKRQKKVESMIAAIKNGDKVITSSGIYGTVAGIKDKRINLTGIDLNHRRILKDLLVKGFR